MPMSMSKKNFTIWIVITVVTFLLVTVGRRWIGFGGVGVGVGSSFITTLGSLIVLVVSLGFFYKLKKK